MSDETIALLAKDIAAAVARGESGVDLIKLATAARIRDMEARIDALRRQIEGHCERIAKQSDLLSKRAERL